jgi:50S ribosomal subunit-associated GTPase HflX
VSAATSAGFGELVAAIESELALDQERVRFTLDDQRERDRRLLADLYRHGRVISQVNDRHRISVEADVPRRLLDRFARGRVPA